MACKYVHSIFKINLLNYLITVYLCPRTCQALTSSWLPRVTRHFYIDLFNHGDTYLAYVIYSHSLLLKPTLAPFTSRICWFTSRSLERISMEQKLNCYTNIYQDLCQSLVQWSTEHTKTMVAQFPYKEKVTAIMWSPSSSSRANYHSILFYSKVEVILAMNQHVISSHQYLYYLVPVTSAYLGMVSTRNLPSSI